MQEDLALYLTRKYPKIFVTKNDKAWPFECNAGWFTLLKDFCSSVQAHIDYDTKRYEQNMNYQELIDKKEFSKLPLYLKSQIEKGTDKPLDLSPPCPQVVAQQVKEKFGTLRFYHLGGDEFCSGALSLAENMSAHICELCGDEGNLRGGSYVQTLCDKHWKESQSYTPPKERTRDEIYLFIEGEHKTGKIKEMISPTEVIFTLEDKEYNASKVDTAKFSYWYCKDENLIVDL